MTCPHCSHDARCHGFRSRQVVSLFGPIRLQRHYYHCKHCRKGLCPRDQLLGLRSHDLTAAADQLVCTVGVLDSFAQAAQNILTPLTGLHVSESTVERCTEAAGERLRQTFLGGATLGDPQAWAWHRDADGKSVAYVLADATGVGMQGEHAAEAAGRMANVVAIANPVPEERDRWAEPTRKRPPPCPARYLASLDGWSELGEVARRQGGQVGMDQADRWVAIGDGGSGLEEWLRSNFPRVEVVILDFWHAAGYVGQLAQALHPQDDQAALAWREQWCHALKHEGGAAVLERLKGLAVPKSAFGCWEEVVRYFTNQVHRMDYPAYRAKGWSIGSGVVESACKRVVGQRLKGGGMRWSEAGANAVCYLRALFLSEPGQWKAFWCTK